MKQLILFILLLTTLSAEYLQGVDASFSLKIQSQLLEKLHSVKQTSFHSNNSYLIHKGWNQFSTPQDGIDIIKTFENIPAVKFVVTYDFESKYWAGFTLHQNILKDLNEMLLLRYLEPNSTFFVLSSKTLQVDVQSTKMNDTCQKLLDSKKYGVLSNSALSKQSSMSKDKTISVQSRYHSHEYRGFYSDTRVTLLYPKIKSSQNRMQKYGPAEPTVTLLYAKEYENQEFFLYDYLEKKCYQGYFPSKKLPPFPVLKEYKD